MKEAETEKRISLMDHVACFGNFNIQNRICRKYCACNIRCSIERSREDQFDILEQLFEMEDIYFDIQ